MDTVLWLMDKPLFLIKWLQEIHGLLLEQIILEALNLVKNWIFLKVSLTLKLDLNLFNYLEVKNIKLFIKCTTLYPMNSKILDILMLI